MRINCKIFRSFFTHYFVERCLEDLTRPLGQSVMAARQDVVSHLCQYDSGYVQVLYYKRD